MWNTYDGTTRFYELKKMKAMDNFKRVKASLPDHLKGYIVDQNEQEYTPEDQAVWRYTLRQLKHFLSENAHASYSQGLEKTGITVNEIPKIEEMCEKLSEFGWAALPVSGFIPPAAFMELQSLGILPIASAMRTVEHILYTPAPDIVHEAAGHAPILVDKDFAKYLKSYANVAKKAIISKEDLDQYDAIRQLSDIKENPDSSPEDIQKAEARLEQVTGAMTFVSEAARLGRMNWWTAEYGLIGDLENPKIYGAGLLSSIGESRSCLRPEVKKLPLDHRCLEYSYDITEKQPQLFVASSFESLEQVLEDMAETLSYRKGGYHGLSTALKAQTVNTVQLDTGLQISGQLSKIWDETINKDKTVSYYKFNGPTQLCYQGRELLGHGSARHPHGFSSPLGKLKGFSQPLSWATEEDLASMGVSIGQSCQLNFESDVTLTGELTQRLEKDGRWLLFTFRNCTVSYKNEILFDPSWGEFDMAIGEKVTSVFAGPGDRLAYGTTSTFSTRTVPKREPSPDEQKLFAIYESIRVMRKKEQVDLEILKNLCQQLTQFFPEQWLPRLEIFELFCRGWVHHDLLKSQLMEELTNLARLKPEWAEVIEPGLEIAEKIFP